MLNSNVYDKASALDLIFGFLQVAQSRGAYSFEESAKIFECMQQFSEFFETSINTKQSESLSQTNEVENEKIHEHADDELTTPAL